MFARIIKTEWRNLFAERSFIVLAIVFAVLIGYSVWSGASWVWERSEQSRAILDKQEKDLADAKAKTAQGFKGSTEPGNYEPNPSDPYTIGMGLQYASLPFSPGSVFSVGQADVLPLDAGVTISTLQRTKADKEGFENPLSFLSGRFDLSFVVVYLLPLFILAVSFNVLSGENERGTLRLLLSQPIKLSKLLTAKSIALFIVIVGIFLVVGLAGVLIASGSIVSELLTRVGLWIALVIAYAAFWFAFAVFVNSFGLSSATNAVICAAGWLILVLILPSILNVVITSTYPVPSRSEMVSAIRSVNLDMRRDGSRIIAEHYQDHPELIPKDGKRDVDDFGLAFVIVQRQQKEKVDAVEALFAEQLRKQQSLISGFRLLSPSIVAQEASNDIAGTGLARYQHFREQVTRFDDAWGEFFVPRIFRKQNLSEADFDLVPRFSYSEESFHSVAFRVLPAIGFLVILSGILFGVSLSRLSEFRFA
jgi:ABC-2 type transport system permease protein